jgi:hypothetical protein
MNSPLTPKIYEACQSGLDEAYFRLVADVLENYPDPGDALIVGNKTAFEDFCVDLHRTCYADDDRAQDGKFAALLHPTSELLNIGFEVHLSESQMLSNLDEWNWMLLSRASPLASLLVKLTRRELQELASFFECHDR